MFEVRAILVAAVAASLFSCPGIPSSRAVRGAVKLTSVPAGADVWIDDVHRGATPALLEVAPGLRALRLEHPGYRPLVRKLRVVAERLYTHHLMLDRLPDGDDAAPGKRKASTDAHPPAAKVRNLGGPGANDTPGSVAVATTPPGLRVFMNEELIPQPTPVFFEIRPGIYELRIEDQGETVYRRTLFVRPGVMSDLNLTIRRTRRIDHSDPWQ